MDKYNIPCGVFQHLEYVRRFLLSMTRPEQFFAYFTSLVKTNPTTTDHLSLFCIFPNIDPIDHCSHDLKLLNNGSLIGNQRAGSLARLGHPLDVRKVTGSNPVRPTKTDKNVDTKSEKHLIWGRTMPSEMFDAEKFVEISERAEYCAVKRLKDAVKLKLHTSKRLYTLKLEPAKAEEIIKKLQCEIREI
jgi:hypothetical protein